MSRQRRPSTATGLLVSGVFALAAAWLAAPPHTPPLYDGIGFPDEAYRFVLAPPGAKATKPPTAATAKLSVDSGGVSEQGFATSAEQGPQVVVFLPGGGLKVPSGATSVTVSAAPVSSPTVAPADGVVFGNTYRVTATTDKGPATLVPTKSNPAQIQLRAPQPKERGVQLERFDGTAWSKVGTGRFGNDIYGGFIPSLGDYALVLLANGAATGVAAHSGPSIGLIIGIVIGLLVLVTLLAVRFSRRSVAGPAQHAPGPPPARN